MKKKYWLALTLIVFLFLGIAVIILFLIALFAPTFYANFKWVLFGVSAVIAIVCGIIGTNAGYELAKKKEEEKKRK